VPPLPRRVRVCRGRGSAAPRDHRQERLAGDRVRVDADDDVQPVRDRAPPAQGPGRTGDRRGDRQTARTRTERKGLRGRVLV